MFRQALNRLFLSCDLFLHIPLCIFRCVVPDGKTRYGLFRPPSRVVVKHIQESKSSDRKNAFYGRMNNYDCRPILAPAKDRRNVLRNRFSSNR
jgi:hypothetical protein